MNQMKKLRLQIEKLNRDEEPGVTVVEYAIMLVLVGLAVAAFGTGLAGSVSSVFSRMLSVLYSST